MVEEQGWIQKVKAGELHWFGMLYERHYRKLFNLCLRFTQNPSDAEEQLQEIFMKLLEKIDQFHGNSSFATWAYRVATFHLINFNQKQKRSREILPLEMLHETPQRRLDPDLAMVLDQALQQLPDGFRKVLLLHDRAGLSHDEIGQMLACAPSTSRSQLCRARVALREKLNHVLKKRNHRQSDGIPEVEGRRE